MSKLIKRVSKFFKNETNKILREVKEFNEYQDLIQNVEFDEEGNQIYQYIAKYDNHGKIIEETTSFIEEEEGENKKYFYENDILSKVIIDSKSGWETVQKYSYNEKQTEITIDSLDEEDILEERVVRIYNDNKYLVEEINYNDEEKLVSRTKRYFSNDNNIIRIEEYNNKNKIEKTTEFSYNKNGKNHETILYNYKGKIIDWQKFYYDENEDIAKQETMNGEIYLFSHNKEEKEIIEQRFSNNGVEVLNKKTKFDNDNNIIELYLQSIYSEENYLFEYEYF